MSCHANEIVIGRVFVSEILGAFLETGLEEGGGVLLSLAIINRQ